MLRHRIRACFAITCLATLPACDLFLLSSRMQRFDAPAVVLREGLDDVDADLLQIEIVNGLGAAHIHRRQIAVPHGWESAATFGRSDGGLALVAPLLLVPYEGHRAGGRQRSLELRRTERWPLEARAERHLLRSDDQPAATRRTFRIGHTAGADGGVVAELFGRCGEHPERCLGPIELRGELAQAQCSTTMRVLLWPGLATFDVALLACAVVLAPIALPIALLKSHDEPID